MSIEFIKVSKKFSGTSALSDISFRIEAGTACGYIGPNGAGKTTTAKIIVGLEKADSGSIIVGGKNAATQLDDIKNTVGYVPETPKLYDSLTPVETISMAAMLRKYDKRKALDRLAQLSEIFNFGESLAKPAGGLSKGTRQKVVLAMALAFNPSILVLDEPTDGLDVQAVHSLRLIIQKFTERGGTVFYSSHLLDVVEGLCSTVIFLDHGKIAGTYRKEDFEGKRGYLENALIEIIGAGNELQLINAFFQDAV